MILVTVQVINRQYLQKAQLRSPQIWLYVVDGVRVRLMVVVAVAIVRVRMSVAVAVGIVVGSSALSGDGGQMGSLDGGDVRSVGEVA